MNVNGSRVLAAAMQRHGCHTLVFSSTSTVYGEADQFTARGTPTTHSPLAQTKLPWSNARAAEPGSWRIANLRYFNPVGPIQRPHR